MGRERDALPAWSSVLSIGASEDLDSWLVIAGSQALHVPLPGLRKMERMVGDTVNNERVDQYFP